MMCRYNRSLSSEREIRSLFENGAKNEDGVEFEKKLLLEGGAVYIADIYCGKELKLPKLVVPAKTVIELKRNLRYDTLYRCRELFERLKKNPDIEHFYVVCTERYFPGSYADKYKEGEFRVFSIDALFDGSSLPQDTDKTEDIEGLSEKKSPEKTKEELVNEARIVVLKQKSTLFLGAGVSIDAGLPSWDKLLKNMLEYGRRENLLEIDTDIDKVYPDIGKQCGNSSIIMARYIKTALKGLRAEDNFDKVIHHALYYNKRREGGKLVDAIAGAVKRHGRTHTNHGLESIITYNYDDFIEQKLDQLEVPNHAVLGSSRADADKFPICHVHGILTEHYYTQEGSKYEPELILSEDRYHEIYREAFHWSNVEQLHALNQTYCFFIGFSMTDPNLRRILDIAHGIGREKKKELPHYAFMRRETNNGLSESQAKENIRIQKEILNNLGINVIWVDNFDEIPKLIDEIFK